MSQPKGFVLVLLAMLGCASSQDVFDASSPKDVYDTNVATQQFGSSPGYVTFKKYRNTAIKGRNDEVLGSGFSQHECEQRCTRAYFDCRSFEFHRKSGKCVLSSATGPRVSGVRGWDLFVARNGGGHQEGMCRNVRTCGECTIYAGSKCAWNDNIFPPSCVPRTECDFTYASPEPAPFGASAFRAPSVSVCKQDPMQCGVDAPDGALLDRNPDAGFGCTTHDQCGQDEYCFSCEVCRSLSPGSIPSNLEEWLRWLETRAYHNSDCGACSDRRVAGQCAPVRNCYNDQDSITGVCPRRW